MMKKLIFLAALLPLLSGLAVADDLSSLSDRDLKFAIRTFKDELRRHEKLQQRLKSSGRSSSNTSRKSAIDAIHEAMEDVVFDREAILGQEHTLMRHNAYTTHGTTDAAEVGTPMATKKTRRRVRSGEAYEHPDALRRLTRMQTLLFSSGRLGLSAGEKQNDSFERYGNMVAEFGSILRTEMNILLNEQQRREDAAVAAAEVDAENTDAY